MLRVLFPTDFSAHSYNALSYAQQLFSKVAVEFTLFQAYEPTALQMLGDISPQVFEKDSEIDLMVLIDYPLNFFDRLMGKSIVKNITFHTSLPFLILPTAN